MAEDQKRTFQDKFMLRLPDGMREQLKEVAHESGRSLNSEIVHRLSNSLGNPNLADLGINLGVELDALIVNAAEANNRTVFDEVRFRLNKSFAYEPTLVRELEEKAEQIQRRYDELMRSFIQLTPEERRLLEERAEIAEYARKRKLKSKDIGKFVRLNPIGNRGRFILTIPVSDYTAINGNENMRDITTNSFRQLDTGEEPED